MKTKDGSRLCETADFITVTYGFVYSKKHLFCSVLSLESRLPII
jgi:hypothetical protein